MSILARRFNPIAAAEEPAPDLKVLPQPAPSAPASAKPGIKKLDLSGIAKKKESGKTEYPVFTDTHASALALRILDDTEQLEALKGALETNKKSLIEMATPFHFQHAHGKVIDKSIGILVDAYVDPAAYAAARLRGEPIRKLRIDFKDSYGLLESERMLVPIIGEQATNDNFHQKFEFKIDGDKLPADSAAEIVGELQALFSKYNAREALTVKEGIVPNSDFHLKRHILFDPDTNIRLQEACPIRAAVATKNVK